MKNKALLWLMLILSLCFSDMSVAQQVEVDLRNTEGFGVSEHLIQINNIVVRTEVDDDSVEGGKRTIAVPYNIAFKFDPNTLHLVPILPSEPEEQDSHCANLTVQVLKSDTGTPLVGSNVTVNQQTLVTNNNGEVIFEGLLPQRTLINVTLAGYFSTSQIAALSCSNPTLVVTSLVGQQPTDPVAEQPEEPVTPSDPSVEEPDNTTPDTEEPTETDTPPPETPSTSEPQQPEEPTGSGIVEVTPAPPAPTAIKIVLNWGEVPRDLDAHLTGPDPSDPTKRFHVFFDNKAVASANLDSDLFSVKKPEIIHIKPVDGAEQIPAGRYRYTVHQFAGAGSIAESDISVEVWVDEELQRTYHPSGNPADLNGVATDIWQVLEILVDADGQLSYLPLKSYANGVNPYDVK